MPIAVISDIHGNYEALKQVLQVIDDIGVDAIWCLGDVVGYGPEPQACVDTIRQRATLTLAGNHDLAVVGELDLATFNPVARSAILWHRAHLDEAALSWLRSLPGRVDLPQVTLAHGSPRAPVWEYVTDPRTAAENYDAFDTPICLIGHSHQAMAWRLLRREDGSIDAQALTLEPDAPLHLEEGGKWLVNPGSVGQPRDGDPRASFALFDPEARLWTWRRVSYDIDRVAEAILRAGLPEVLGRSLYLGW
jgi:predicted phosphodiesterase